MIDDTQHETAALLALEQPATEEERAKQAAMAIAIIHSEWTKGSQRSWRYWLGCMIGCGMATIGMLAVQTPETHFMVKVTGMFTAASAAILLLFLVKPSTLPVRHPSQFAIVLHGLFDSTYFILFISLAMTVMISLPSHDSWDSVSSSLVANCNIAVVCRVGHSSWLLRKGNPCNEVKQVRTAIDVHTGSPAQQRIVFTTSHELYSGALVGVFISAATLLAIYFTFQEQIEDTVFKGELAGILGCALLCLLPSLYFYSTRKDPVRLAAREAVAVFPGFHSCNKERDLSFFLAGTGLLWGMLFHMIVVRAVFCVIGGGLAGPGTMYAMIDGLTLLPMLVLFLFWGGILVVLSYTVRTRGETFIAEVKRGSVGEKEV